MQYFQLLDNKLGIKFAWPNKGHVNSVQGSVNRRLYSHSCNRTQSTVNGQTAQIDAVNGQSSLNRWSDRSAERTQITVLTFASDRNGLQQYNVGGVTRVY